ncbi:MAG: type III-B CRISPR module RAMP protein Cmr1 [Actinobacteria bacterium]|nr:type III-B CRISPR module RAMP protein Cmr1 [Actinomycetota bacterium]
MLKKTFQCEVITPMFLGGADQQPELRPPSIRGAMRWWFRALYGGHLYSTSRNLIDELKRKEKEIFGDTSQQSLFDIKIKSSINDNDIETHNFRNPYFRYLSYGLYQMGSDSPPSRKYIKPNKTFTVEMKFRTNEEKIKKLVCGTFWMLTYFGNIGSRSRRGLGSFNIVNSSYEYLPIVSDFNSLQEGINKIISNDYFGITRSPLTINPEFPILHPNFWQGFLLSKTFNNSVDALKDIGEKLRKFREDKSTSASFRRTLSSGRTISGQHSKEYKNIIKSKPASGKSKLVGIPLWSIFGLPHPFKLTGIEEITIAGENRERRASPLFIKILELGENNYQILLQKFESKFLDSKVKFYNALDEEIISGSIPFTQLNSFISSFTSPSRQIII